MLFLNNLFYLKTKDKSGGFNIPLQKQIDEDGELQGIRENKKPF